MKQLPKEFLDNMKELLQEEYEEFLDSYNDKPINSLRINTDKISVKDFLNINPFHLTPIPWTNDGFYYETKDSPSKHPYFYAGLYYIQEASAMLPAETLPVDKNDIILDACAAPGGKSLKLANKLNQTGLLISNDISVSRCQILLKNLESRGVRNMIVMAEDLNNLSKSNYQFDKILLDAPCSGEGMFRKDNDLVDSWIKKNSDYYAPLQKELLINAIRMLKPSGYLVYSTCTFSIKENEEVIEHVLDMFDDIEIQPIKQYPGFKQGLTNRTTDCIRLYPHKVKAEGHFVCLIKKSGDKQIKEITENQLISPIDILKNIQFSSGKFVNRNEKLFYQTNIDFDTEGLRILRNGLYLGQFNHDRFETSQALASSIKMEEFDNIINFHLQDPRVIKYLKCETLDVKDKYVSGNVLVCVDNFPLGFATVNKGILKNKYPANYRYK